MISWEDTTMSRLDKWKKEQRISIGIVGSGNEELMKLVEQIWEKSKKEESQGILWSLIQAAKELIFDIENGKPVFHVVNFALDAKTVELVLAPSFKILGLDTKDEVKRILAIAMAVDVPVYPNTDDVAPKLVAYHKDLLTHGFKEKDRSGKELHVVPTKFQDVDLESLQFIERVKSQEMFPPAELSMIKAVAMKEIKEREQAGLILASLRSGINELSELLQATKPNESYLQDCLTKNPILFGSEYQQVFPKHRLDGKYVMDYALKRVSGLVDLVEIEASTRRLYTEGGQPSQYLVHAEQQVLDWLKWMEKHPSYAWESLSRIQRPIGYVIIGRSSSLSPTDKGSLVQRNITFRDTIRIITYDDLLQRAQNLLSWLKDKGSGNNSTII